MMMETTPVGTTPAVGATIGGAVPGTEKASRRTFLRAAGGVLLARGVAPLLASGAAGPLIAGVTSARPAAAAPRIKTGGVLNVAIGTSISSLEPQVTTETSSGGVRTNLYDMLAWQYTSDGSFTPMLATKWEVSPNGLMYTFTLTDKAVKFHDGTAFSAEAVKATFDRLLEPSRSGAAKLTLDMVSGVEVLNARTVRFTLQHVFAPFLHRIADNPGAIMSPDAIKKFGEDYGRHPVGTGPYRFVEYVPGDHVTMERNPEYWNWGGPAYCDRLVYKIVPEDSSRAALLESGEAQVVDRVAPADAQRLQGNDKVRIVRTVTSRLVYFVLNQNRPLMRDVRVRQAVNYAVDRPTIIKEILKGAAVLADSPLGRGEEFYAPQKPYPYDPAKAKALLKEAGVPEGAKLVIWTPSGRYVDDKEISTAVQDMLRKAGFDASLQAFGDFPAYIKQLDTLAFDMAMWGWTSSNDADSYINQIFATRFSKKFPNWGSYSNPRVDDLLSRAVAELENAKRASLYAEAQRLLMADAAALFMHYQVNLTGAGRDVAGVLPVPFEILIVRNAGLTA
jgi:ABC-type transport system substrate-binding protein